MSQISAGIMRLLRILYLLETMIDHENIPDTEENRSPGVQ